MPGPLSGEEIARLAYQAGFRGEGLAKIIAITKRESGWDPGSYNGNEGTGDNSVGLAQINLLGTLGPARGRILQQLGYSVDPNDQEAVRRLLHDPLVNLQVAYAMSSGGTDFYPWGGYKGVDPTSGTNIDEGRALAASAGDGSVSAQGSSPAAPLLNWTGPSEYDDKQGHYWDPATSQWHYKQGGGLYLGSDVGGGTGASAAPMLDPTPPASSLPNFGRSSSIDINNRSTYSGVPNEQVSDLGSGGWRSVTTGGSAGSLASDYQGFHVYDENFNPITGAIDPNTPIWLERMAKGTGMNRYPTGTSGSPLWNWLYSMLQQRGLGQYLSPLNQMFTRPQMQAPIDTVTGAQPAAQPAQQPAQTQAQPTPVDTTGLPGAGVWGATGAVGSAGKTFPAAAQSQPSAQSAQAPALQPSISWGATQYKPPTEQFSPYTPPSPVSGFQKWGGFSRYPGGTGTTTATGTQIPLDAGYLLNLLLGQQNQANANANQVAIANMNAGVTMAGLKADFSAKMIAAKAQYLRDVAQLGLDQATLNYNQRLADANLTLQTQSQNLQDAMQGYTQRAGAAQMKLDAMKALADRSGPQDWVKYYSLLGGIGSPVPQGTTVDPTKFADNLVDSRYRDPNQRSGIVGQAPSVNQPYSGVNNMPALDFPTDWNFGDVNPAAASSVAGGGTSFGGGATGSTTQGGGGSNPYAPPAPNGQRWLNAPGTNPNSPYPAGSYQNPNIAPNQRTVTGAPQAQQPGAYSGVPNEQVAGTPSGGWAFVTTGTAGPSRVSDYQGWRVFDSSRNQMGDPNQMIQPGTPVWLQRMARGSGQGAASAQLLLQALLASKGGMPASAESTPPPAAPAGTTTDRAMLIGDAPMSQPPDAGGAKPEAVFNPTGAPIGVLSHEETMQLLRLLMKMHGQGEEGSEPMMGPGQMMAEEQGEPMPGQGGMMEERSSGDASMANEPMEGDVLDLKGQILRAAKDKAKKGAPPPPARHAGGTIQVRAHERRRRLSAAERRQVPKREFGVPSKAPGPGSYPMPDKNHARAALSLMHNASPAERPGIKAKAEAMLKRKAGGTYGMPDLPTYTNYNPSDFGNLPFLRRIQGRLQDQSQWKGFGQPLANNNFGIYDMPTTINLRTYNALSGSEQKGLQGTYNDALQFPWEDVYSASQRAAPVAQTAYSLANTPTKYAGRTA